MIRKISIFYLIFIIVLTSGCKTIRKKFIRKKKSTKETPVYVNFKDYPTKPSKEAYIDYYLFVRGWIDELIGALNKNISYKRKKRAVKEALMNLEQIISFYSDQGKEKIYPLYENLLSVQTEIEKSPQMSTMKASSMIRKTENFKRAFERDFNYTDAEKWMQ